MRRVRVLAASCLLALAACSGEECPPDGPRRTVLRVTVAPGLPAEVAELTLTVLDGDATCRGPDAVGGAARPGFEAVRIGVGGGATEIVLAPAGAQIVASVVARDAAGTALARGCSSAPVTCGPLDLALVLAAYPDCAAACTGGTCVGGVCEIACGTLRSCPGRVVCPAGIPCRVLCDGAYSCAGGVDCAGPAACDVRCGGLSSCGGDVTCRGSDCSVSCAGDYACAGAVDAAVGGACVIACGGLDSCQGTVTCAAASGRITCDGDYACGGGLECRAASRCDIDCAGLDSCASVACGPGVCAIACGGDYSCSNLGCASSCACDVACGGLSACQAVPVCPPGCASAGACTSGLAGCDTC